MLMLNLWIKLIISQAFCFSPNNCVKFFCAFEYPRFFVECPLEICQLFPLVLWLWFAIDLVFLCHQMIGMLFCVVFFVVCLFLWVLEYVVDKWFDCYISVFVLLNTIPDLHRFPLGVLKGIVRIWCICRVQLDLFVSQQSPFAWPRGICRTGICYIGGSFVAILCVIYVYHFDLCLFFSIGLMIVEGVCGVSDYLCV